MTLGWERRGTGNYLYLTRRAPSGKVVKQYVGRGPLASIAAEGLARRRAEREDERRALADLRTALAAADGLTAELAEAAGLLLVADLLGRGFHRLNYGRWRRLRNAQAGC